MSKLYVIEGSAKTWQEAIRLTADVLLEQGCVYEDFYQSCVSREYNYPTGLTDMCPIAIPHTSKEHVKQEAICALRLSQPVEFGRIDDGEQKVQIKYVLNLAFLDDEEHLNIISRIIHCLKNPHFSDELDKMNLDELRVFLKSEFMEEKGE